MDVWTLWTYCNTQWRAGGFGVVGIDLPAVRQVAATLGIAWTQGMLGKIRALERAALERLHQTKTTATDKGAADDRHQNHGARRRKHL